MGTLLTQSNRNLGTFNNFMVPKPGLCRSSCGLWMLNFMEYFTGDTLSDIPKQVYFALYHNTYYTLYLYLKTNADYYLIGSYDTF